MPLACRHTQRPHASRAVPPHASHARLSARQSALAFNQALSFDTSSVTDMERMFSVRSARALAPRLESGPPRARCLRRRHPTPSRLPAQPPHTPLPASHSRLSTRQDAKAFNQPLSFDTSKVTQMLFMFSVRSARAMPPHSLQSVPPCACRLHYHHPTPSHPASHASSFRLGRGARASSSSGCREAAPRPALRIEDLHRGVGDRG